MSAIDVVVKNHRGSAWTRIALAGAAGLVLGAGAGAAASVAPWYVPAVGLAVVLGAVFAVLRASGGTPNAPYARWRDVMPCYLSVQDRELRIIDTNELFKREFGEKVGEFCYSAYKGASAPCPDCPVLTTFCDGRIHTGEETVKSLDGTTRNVVVTSAPVRGDDGTVEAVVEMSTDITELKSLRDELERSRRDYRLLFESVPCYICVLDRDFKIVECNDLYRRGFGDAVGRYCFQACKGRDNPCRDCLVERTFQDGQVHSSEETLVTLEGRQLNLVVHSMPIKEEDGRIRAVMEVFTDITEVKELQRRLTLMGRAVAGMAHRIKNLLMGLEGGIFVVNTGMESDDKAMVAEGWEMVERNVKRVSRIVKDLLYCSKERQPDFKEGVSPADIAREVHELYARKTRDEGIELVLEVDDALEPGFYDPEGIHSLLSNLVANAIDACRFDTTEGKESHTIRMRCLKGDSGATVFEVEDDGAGIPEEYSDKVFEDFFSTKGTEGTGVGLLVVQKVAHEHGGTVTFESEPGRGTRFKVVLPPA